MISCGPVRPETAAAACQVGTSQETYGVEGTGLPTPGMPNRVATEAVPRYRPLRFAERPPFGGKVAPRQGAGARMSSLDAIAGPRKPPGASNYPVQLDPHPVERLGHRPGVA